MFIHWLLLNIVTTVHQRLYACDIAVYRQRLEPWSLPSVPHRRCEDFVQQWARHLGESNRVPKLWSAGSTKLLGADFPSLLASPGTVGHYGLLHAHWLDIQWIARTIVWPYWNLAVGGDNIKWCSHSSLHCAISTAVTGLKLNCNIPTYSLPTAMRAHSRPTSHIISGLDLNWLTGRTSYFKQWASEL